MFAYLNALDHLYLRFFEYVFLASGGLSCLLRWNQEVGVVHRECWGNLHLADQVQDVVEAPSLEHVVLVVQSYRPAVLALRHPPLLEELGGKLFRRAPRLSVPQWRLTCNVQKNISIKSNVFQKRPLSKRYHKSMQVFL